MTTFLTFDEFKTTNLIEDKWRDAFVKHIANNNNLMNYYINRNLNANDAGCYYRITGYQDTNKHYPLAGFTFSHHNDPIVEEMRETFLDPTKSPWAYKLNDVIAIRDEGKLIAYIIKDLSFPHGFNLAFGMRVLAEFPSKINTIKVLKDKLPDATFQELFLLTFYVTTRNLGGKQFIYECRDSGGHTCFNNYDSYYIDHGAFLTGTPNPPGAWINSIWASEKNLRPQFKTEQFNQKGDQFTSEQPRNRFDLIYDCIPTKELERTLKVFRQQAEERKTKNV